MEEIKRFSLDWNKDVYLDDCWQIKSFSSLFLRNHSEVLTMTRS